MTDHDHGYKLLFSEPDMVRDLLRGFVHEAWVAELDFDTLERVAGSFVSEHLRERETDVIWRVRWGGSWLYVYLLLEFQSRVDPFMALRMQSYVSLLHQDLVRGRQLAPGGLLPPVVPLVLYNGTARWRAATDVAELVQPMPGGLERYRPAMAYLLLDEGALSETDLAPLRNLAAALFRLERSRTPADLATAVAALSEWLIAPEQARLRRAFTIWIRRVLLPGRLPGARIPEVGDLQEVRSMLAERVIDWTRDWKQQGLEEGRREGREKGLEEGRAEGRAEGREEGREEGRREALAAVLMKQLTRKFGPLPPDIPARIGEAGAEQLERWTDRILDAGTLAEVFG